MVKLSYYYGLADSDGLEIRCNRCNRPFPLKNRQIVYTTKISRNIGVETSINYFISYFRTISRIPVAKVNCKFA